MSPQNAWLDRSRQPTELRDDYKGGSASRLVNITGTAHCNEYMEKRPMIESRLAFAAMITASALFAPFTAKSQTLTTLHSFTGSSDGLKPGPLLSVDGKLFGTTSAGGTSDKGRSSKSRRRVRRRSFIPLGDPTALFPMQA